MKKILLFILIIILMGIGIYLSIKMSFDKDKAMNDIETTTSPIESEDVNEIETTQNNPIQNNPPQETTESVEKYDEDNTLSDEIKSNVEGVTVTEEIKNNLENKMWNYFSLGDFEGGTTMFYQELKNYSMEEDSEDLLKLYQEASALIHLNKIDLEYSLNILNLITNDELLINGLIRSRKDIQMATIIDSNSLIIYTEDEINYVGKAELSKDEETYFNEKYPNGTFTKYVFMLSGEKLNGFIFYNKDNERRVAGFYFDSEETKLVFSKKSDLE